MSKKDSKKYTKRKNKHHLQYARSLHGIWMD